MRYHYEWVRMVVVQDLWLSISIWKENCRLSCGNWRVEFERIMLWKQIFLVKSWIRAMLFERISMPFSHWIPLAPNWDHRHHSQWLDMHLFGRLVNKKGYLTHSCSVFSHIYPIYLALNLDYKGMFTNIREFLPLVEEKANMTNSKVILGESFISWNGELPRVYLIEVASPNLPWIPVWNSFGKYPSGLNSWSIFSKHSSWKFFQRDWT